MNDRTQSISILEQIAEAELHLLALRDHIERFEGSRKRPQSEIERKRDRLRVAEAIVATLQAFAQMHDVGAAA